MLRTSLVALSFLLVCTPARIILGQTAGSPAELPDPELTNEAAEQSFRKGKSLLREGKAKEAEALFKKLRPQGKTAKDKQTLEDWEKVASAEQVLASLRERVAKKDLERTYDEALAQSKRYAGTAAAASFKKFTAELEGRLFVVLEDFNRLAGPYNKKYGKEHERRPQFLADGTACLRWTNTPDRKAGWLKIDKVPPDWRQFSRLEFWVNVKKPPSSLEAVIMCKEVAGQRPPPRRAGEPAPTGRQSFYRAPLALKSTGGKWQRIRIPIGEFESNGSGSLGEVESFHIQVAGGTPFEMLIDSIVLVRGAGTAKS